MSRFLEFKNEMLVLLLILQDLHRFHVFDLLEETIEESKDFKLEKSIKLDLVSDILESGDL
jgi:hypothetical protein